MVVHLARRHPRWRKQSDERHAGRRSKDRSDLAKGIGRFLVNGRGNKCEFKAKDAVK